MKEYYPRALELCEDLTAGWAQAFLACYPTSAAAATLTEADWGAFARAHRLGTTRTAALWETLQQPQLPLPAHVVRLKARLLQALLRELAPILSGVAEYRQAIDDFFSTMPMAEIARSLPVGKSGTTVPAVWAELGDNVDRWDSFRHVQGYAGSVPETERSGKHLVVSGVDRGMLLWSSVCHHVKLEASRFIRSTLSRNARTQWSSGVPEAQSESLSSR